MRKAIKAGLAAAIAIGIAVGVAVASGDFWHANGVGTDNGIVIGSGVPDPYDVAEDNEIAFTGNGTIAAEGDLMFWGRQDYGAIHFLEDGTGLMGLDNDAAIGAVDSPWPLAVVWAGDGNGEEATGIVEAATAGGQYLVLDGSAQDLASVTNGEGSTLALEDGSATLTNALYASVDLDPDGNVQITNGYMGAGVSFQLGD